VDITNQGKRQDSIEEQAKRDDNIKSQAKRYDNIQNKAKRYEIIKNQAQRPDNIIHQAERDKVYAWASVKTRLKAKRRITAVSNPMEEPTSASCKGE
jgi:hypothetical protein